MGTYIEKAIEFPELILPFIVLILVVVFIHEYGHYYFAKNME